MLGASASLMNSWKATHVADILDVSAGEVVVAVNVWERAGELAGASKALDVVDFCLESFFLLLGLMVC